MFRFIHAADLHLDSPLQGLDAHDGAPVDVLRGATRRAFENLIDLALTEKVDFLVIAGDVFDRDWKDYSTGLFFRKQMTRLNENDIPVFLIAGNHDAASLITKRLTLPGNVKTFPTRAAESIELPHLPVVIHGRGFPNRSVPENLAKEYPAAIPGLFNLGVLHTSLTGQPGRESYAPCSKEDLIEKGYDYWALGHVHQPEIISRSPWIVFSGNCQGRHVREPGKRGCQMVQVNDLLDVDFVEQRDMDVVRWAILPVDLNEVEREEDVFRRIRTVLSTAVDASEGRLLAVRLVLQGNTPLHGRLLRNTQYFRAEIQAIIQDLGEDKVWIEQIKLDTGPVYDLKQLGARDALTQIVLETLEQSPPELHDLPADIREMLDVLPTEIKTKVEKEWEVERGSAMKDVQAIVLEALQSSREDLR